MPLRTRRPAYRKKRTMPRPLAAKKAARRRPRSTGYGRSPRYMTSAGGFTNSLWSYGARNRLPRQVLAMKRVGAPDINHENGGGVIQAIQGYQQYYAFELLPQEKLADIAATAGSQATPNRLVIENILADMTFSNTTNTLAELEIYDLVLKRDVPDSASWVIGTNTYNAGGGDPTEYIRAGVNAANGVAPGLNYHEIVGSSPYDSQFFTSYFKVVKKSHVMLGTGASHRHQCMIKVNKVITQAVAAQGNAAGLRGFSHYVLVLVRGAAGSIVAGILYPDPPVSATAAQIQLPYVYTQRIKYTFVQDATQTVNLDDNLTHTALPLAVRNPASGALESVSPV